MEHRAITAIEEARAGMQSLDCLLVATSAEQLAADGARLATGDLERARTCIARGRGIGLRMGLTRSYMTIVDATDVAAAATHLLDEVADPEVHDEVFWALIDRGAESLPALVALTRRRNTDVRWRAYDAIQRIGGGHTLPLLVRGLADDVFAIRWVAAHGLVLAGRVALVPVLHALVHEPASLPFHQAVRIVLRRLDATGMEEEMAMLVESLGRGTTVYESEGLALELLDRLRRDARAAAG